MKIALLVSTFPPKWLAGTEIATYNIAKYLARRGHEVHVITSLDSGLPKKNIEEGFYIHRVKLNYKIPFLSIFIYFIKIVLLISQINPDIVHSQSLIAGWMTVLIKIFLRIPCVVFGRGSDIYTEYKFKKTILKLTLRKADAIIALTEDMRNEMKKIYNRDIFVIPNGINIDNYVKVSKNKIFNKDKTILFVGTLRPIKGVKYLIESMKIIQQYNPNIRLMLVGNGNDKENLNKLVDTFKLSGCINFVGQIPNEIIPKYMAISDIFVLPSLSEGFPVVILEAMASGLPIVATKVGGLAEIVKDGINGYLVDPCRPEEIAEKVILILEDDKLSEKISKNNKEKALNYNWDRVVERLEDVYQKCLLST